MRLKDHLAELHARGVVLNQEDYLTGTAHCRATFEGIATFASYRTHGL